MKKLVVEGRRGKKREEEGPVFSTTFLSNVTGTYLIIFNYSCIINERNLTILQCNN